MLGHSQCALGLLCFRPVSDKTLDGYTLQQAGHVFAGTHVPDKHPLLTLIGQVSLILFEIISLSLYLIVFFPGAFTNKKATVGIV